MKNVLITGVSTGIGFALTEQLLSEGYFVIGSVRKKQDAEKLRATFGANFKPLIFDIANHTAVEQGYKDILSVLQGQGLAALINNAGIVVEGALKYIKPAELQHQFSVNVFGTLKVIQTFLPLLGGSLDSEYPPGRIININSVSGLITLPFTGAYASSKHALESITDGLRRELDIYGIDVVSVNPGAVKTPIWDKVTNQQHALENTDYENFIPYVKDQVKFNSKNGLPAMSVARSVANILKQKKTRANYILMNGGVLLKAFLFLPKNLQDKIIQKMRTTGK